MTYEPTDAQLTAACDAFALGGATIREAIRAAISAAEKAAWRPIAEAPKDGEFVVYLPDEKTRFHTARFRPNVKTIGHLFAFDMTPATHFRPLPPPPEQTT